MGAAPVCFPEGEGALWGILPFLSRNRQASFSEWAGVLSEMGAGGKLNGCGGIFKRMRLHC